MRGPAMQVRDSGSHAHKLVNCVILFQGDEEEFAFERRRPGLFGVPCSEVRALLDSFTPE